MPCSFSLMVIDFRKRLRLASATIIPRLHVKEHTYACSLPCSLLSFLLYCSPTIQNGRHRRSDHCPDAARSGSDSYLWHRRHPRGRNSRGGDQPGHSIHCLPERTGMQLCRERLRIHDWTARRLSSRWGTWSSPCFGRGKSTFSLSSVSMMLTACTDRKRNDE